MLDLEKIFLSFHTIDDKLCEICHFAVEDLPEIVAIEQQASSCPWSEQNFKDSLESSHVCVGVRLEQRWVAVAVYSLAADEAELLLLAVIPMAQGRGIATNLLMLMEEPLSKVANEVFLEVRETNFRAINLYESLGFHLLGERPNYYPVSGQKGRETALIYGKHISNHFYVDKS